MLCSRPARAHPPIVAAVKRIFEEARMSAASARVIQSVEAAIDQSDVFDAPDVAGFSVGFGARESDELDELDDAVSDLLDDDPDASASEDAATSLFDPSSDPEPPPPFDAPDAAVVRRSFFAQPDPL